jgi:uncharacterized UPF0146 family protein
VINRAAQGKVVEMSFGVVTDLLQSCANVGVKVRQVGIAQDRVKDANCGI